MTRTLIRYFGSHCWSRMSTFYGLWSQPEGEVYPRKTIENIDVFPSVQIIDSALSVDLEGVCWRIVKLVSRLSAWTGGGLTLVHFDVDGSPPDIILGSLFVDDALVLWAASSLLAREIDKSSRGGDDGAFVANGVFVEDRDRGVALQIDLIHVETGLGVELEVLANDYRGESDNKSLWIELGILYGHQ